HRPAGSGYELVGEPIMADEVRAPCSLPQQQQRRPVQHHRIPAGKALDQRVPEGRWTPEGRGIADAAPLLVYEDGPRAEECRYVYVAYGLGGHPHLFRKPDIVLITEGDVVGIERLLAEETAKVLGEAGARPLADIEGSLGPALAPKRQAGHSRIGRRVVGDVDVDRWPIEIRQ